MKNSGMTIGEAARRAGCTPATIRFYEAEGLMRPVSRGQNGRRVYTSGEIARLRFIRRCRDLDFSLDDIRALLRVQDGAPCEAARDAAEARLQEVRRKRAELEALERSLAALATHCTDACLSGARSCGVVDVIARD